MAKFNFSGKTIQKAIENGLKELGVKQEDVDIKVLAEGGLFSKAKIEIITEDRVKKAPAKTETKTEKKKTKEVKKETKKQEKKQEKNVKKTAKEKTSNKSDESIENFIKLINKELDLNLKVEKTEVKDHYDVNITGEKSSLLIGYRGECLNAIQYLINTISLRKNEDHKKIYLNIAGYKEKREEALKGLANRLAEKAIKTSRYQKLEPMNAYERRIIHSALTENKEVKTISKGEEPRRYVVIERV